MFNPSKINLFKTTVAGLPIATPSRYTVDQHIREQDFRSALFYLIYSGYFTR